MTLPEQERDEARDAREQALGIERDRPSWREAREDQRDISAAIEKDLGGSGVRADGWELTHAAARRWADRNTARITT